MNKWHHSLLRRKIGALIIPLVVGMVFAGSQMFAPTNTAAVSPGSITAGVYSGPLAGWNPNSYSGGVGGWTSNGDAAFGPATGTNISYGLDYMPGGDWSTIDGDSSGGSYLPDDWGNKCDSGTAGTPPNCTLGLMLGLPIISNDGTDTLAAGATGAYNKYFVELGNNLVKDHLANTILRPGWEFTGWWYAWGQQVDSPASAHDFAKYYQQIVTAMRSVPGQHFKFVWDGAYPQAIYHADPYTAADAYPGSQYVDYIGNDTYDQDFGTSCRPAQNNTSTIAQSECVWQNNTEPQLDAVASFAAAPVAYDGSSQAARPIAFPEWGLADRGDGGGMGDDPTFIDNMASWMSSHNVTYDAYFNFDIWANQSTGQPTGPDQVDCITCTDPLTGQLTFPKSLAEFKKDFGAGSPPPPPTPTPTPTYGITPTPTPPTSTPTPTATPTPSQGQTPGTPTNFTAAASGSTVTLKWTNQANTDGVNIYRTNSAGTVTKIWAGGYPNPAPVSYQDSNVPNGAYSYAIAAYNSVGESPKTKGTSVTVTSAGGVPTAPTNLTGSTSGEKVSLTWTASANAQTQEIFRGDGVLVEKVSATATSAHFTASAKGHHQYWVIGVNAAGKSTPSNRSYLTT